MSDLPATIRYSIILSRIRHTDGQQAADDFEKLVTSIGRTCPVHGYLKDPMVFVTTCKQLAVACPDCSSPRLKEMWEAEKQLS